MMITIITNKQVGREINNNTNNNKLGGRIITITITTSWEGE